MNAGLAGARDELIRAAVSDEITAGLLEAVAPALDGHRAYRLHAGRARAAARLLRANAAMLREIAGPEALCLFGHGRGERRGAA